MFVVGSLTRRRLLDVLVLMDLKLPRLGREYAGTTKRSQSFVTRRAAATAGPAIEVARCDQESVIGCVDVDVEGDGGGARKSSLQPREISPSSLLTFCVGGGGYSGPARSKAKGFGIEAQRPKCRCECIAELSGLFVWRWTALRCMMLPGFLMRMKQIRARWHVGPQARSLRC